MKEWISSEKWPTLRGQLSVYSEKPANCIRHHFPEERRTLTDRQTDRHVESNQVNKQLLKRKERKKLLTSARLIRWLANERRASMTDGRKSLWKISERWSGSTPTQQELDTHIYQYLSKMDYNGNMFWPVSQTHLVSWASVVTELQLPRRLLGSRERMWTQWSRTPLRYKRVFTSANTQLCLLTPAVIRISSREHSTNSLELTHFWDLAIKSSNKLSQHKQSNLRTAFNQYLHIIVWPLWVWATKKKKPRECRSLNSQLNY